MSLRGNKNLQLCSKMAFPKIHLESSIDVSIFMDTAYPTLVCPTSNQVPSSSICLFWKPFFSTLFYLCFSRQPIGISFISSSSTSSFILNVDTFFILHNDSVQWWFSCRYTTFNLSQATFFLLLCLLEICIF